MMTYFQNKIEAEILSFFRESRNLLSDQGFRRKTLNLRQK